jgi:hypothetical protein
MMMVLGFIMENGAVLSNEGIRKQAISTYIDVIANS